MSDPTPPETDVPADDAVIGVAFRWSIGVIVVAAAVVAVVLLLRGRAGGTPEVVERAPVVAPDVLPPRPEMPMIPFTDVTAEAGIDFVHVSGATGEKLLPETMGGGCAFLDFDDDGDEDVLFANGRPWPHDATDDAPPTMALYENDGAGRFSDVTAQAGLAVSFYGMGVACGDYDGDGRVDVYVTALGANRLFWNSGQGFIDLTDQAGVAGAPDQWSSSAGFFDSDGDGDLDLFVCNYVAWSRELDLDIGFTLDGTNRAYGPPTQYPGTFCSLYRNEGDGTFTDVSGPAGIQVVNEATGKPAGKALAVTFVDVDGDGRLDVFVANDTVRNFLFRNRGDGTFAEIGAETGVAFDTMGAATGAMGIDAADFANDGRLGVGIANFSGESTSFFVQQPRRPWQFADMADPEGIGSPSRLRLSFGLVFLDADLDGRLDLLQANGHLEDEINAIQPSQTYRQPAQLFWNCGPAARACFAAAPAENVGDLARPIVGRGASCADVDDDGDLDVLLTQVGGPPTLLRNDLPPGPGWLHVELLARRPGNRHAIGGRVEVTAGGVTQTRRVMPTRSYLSQVPLAVTFGLGDARSIDRVRVTWPDGAEQVVAGVEPNTRLVVEQAPD